VSWWTNIRFEKTFSEDLCKLLAASGCIAVTGGLEVASPRLLDMMEKGITIDQVARVCKGFRDAGILVHAYLMYGFPTESEQETIDSLEVVRQLFEHNLLQSAFWHQFAMTVHSPVGLNPEKYNVVRTGPEFKGFANNDLYHDDPTGADHEKYSEGLKKALYNYMHGNGLDFPLKKWFSFPIPNTNVPRTLIANSVKMPLPDPLQTAGYILTWHGVTVKALKRSANGREMLFVNAYGIQKVELPEPVAQFILDNEPRFALFADEPIILMDTIKHFASALKMDEEKIIRQEWWKKWRGVVWVVKN
jgi:Radical SAM superfamily